jgi:hypothetical protein
MKTLSAIVLSIFMLAGVFSFQTVSANPPDAHQQAMEIHNQHHQQAHQQAMEASRRAEEAHRRYMEENQHDESMRHREYNGWQIRRMNQSRRNNYFAPTGQKSLLDRIRERREARRALREMGVQQED